MDLDHVDVWRLEPEPADDNGAPERRVHQHGGQRRSCFVVHVLGAKADMVAAFIVFAVNRGWEFQ